MSGYDGNYFGPGDTITRAQVAKVATLVGGLHTAEVENAGSPSFADVVPCTTRTGTPSPTRSTTWRKRRRRSGDGGSPDDGVPIFQPNEAITRVQLAQILARMARQLKGYGAIGLRGLGGTGPAAPSPSLTFPTTRRPTSRWSTSLGLMSGYSDQTFGPWAGAQRAHVAVAMSRYLDLPDWRRSRCHRVAAGRLTVTLQAAGRYARAPSAARHTSLHGRRPPTSRWRDPGRSRRSCGCATCRAGRSGRRAARPRPAATTGPLLATSRTARSRPNQVFTENQPPRHVVADGVLDQVAHHPLEQRPSLLDRGRLQVELQAEPRSSASARRQGHLFSRRSRPGRGRP